MHAAALLLLATTSSFVLPPQGSVMRVAHRQRSAPQMNWLKNLVDPEDAMGRNVLADELAGGDGSAPPKQKPQKPRPKPKPGQKEPGFEMPKLPELPNPFGFGKK